MLRQRARGACVFLVASLAQLACEPAVPACYGTPSWPAEPPLQEPAGLHVLSDQSWNALRTTGWGYLRRTSSKDDDICTDSAAGRSVLRIVFTRDMAPNTEPSVHWIGLPSVRAVYAAWWVKLSSNWTPSPAGGGKISFLHTATQHIYINIGGSRAPHRINMDPEWAPYGQSFWEPNVTTTKIYYGQWYRIEWYMQWESSPGARDGIIRWWVNGVLNGDYTTVRYPDDSGFQQFEFAPTRQNPPPVEQYMYIDHTYVSIQ